MAEPKALKISHSKPSGAKGIEYLENPHSETFIQVPKSVLNVFRKIHDLPAARSIVFMDVLAVAIKLRRSENISSAIETWNQSEIKSHYYPNCSANTSFSKLIRDLRKTFYYNEITDNETEKIIHFFAKCPHGYDVTLLLRPHVEHHPVTT